MHAVSIFACLDNFAVYTVYLFTHVRCVPNNMSVYIQTEKYLKKTAVSYAWEDGHHIGDVAKTA